MMADQSILDEGPKKTPGKTAVQMLVGAAFGYGAVFAFDKIVGVKWLVDNSTGSGVFAFVLAMIFALIAIIVFAMSFSKKLFTYNREYADMDGEEYTAQQPILRWSALGMIVYAGAFVLLALANPASGVPQTAYFGGVVAAMVVQLAIGAYLWKIYDELWREVTKEACAVSFTIIEVVLFIWAAASIFGLGVTFDPLAVLVTTTAIYTLVSVWLTVRKGMAK